MKKFISSAPILSLCAILSLILSAFILSLCACGKSEQPEEQQQKKQQVEEQQVEETEEQPIEEPVLQFIRYMDAEHNLAEYRDAETGVHYILYTVKEVNVQDGIGGNAHNGYGVGVGVGVGVSITERLDSNGDTYIEEEYKNQTYSSTSEQ